MLTALIGKEFLHKRIREKEGEPIESEPPTPPEASEDEPETDPISPANGNLTPKEQLELRAYALAKKHHLFADASDEELSAFAREPAEEQSVPVDEPAPEAETPETPEQGGATV